MYVQRIGGLVVAAICGIVAVDAAGFQTVSPADVVYHGGLILTLNDEQPTARAVAVRDGRIIMVGSNADVLATAGEGTQRVDLDGRTLLPGFVDSHGHAYMVGIQATTASLLPPPDGNGKNIDALVSLLNEWASTHEAAIERIGWIAGFGYDDSQLAEQRHPTRHDLDSVSDSLPVIIIHQSGHLGVANSRALELAGVTVDTEDPDGGAFRREPGSRIPNGVCEELAFFYVLSKLAEQFDDEVNDIFVEEGTKLIASFGYTTAQEGRATESAIQALRRVARRGDLKIDVVAYPDILEVENIEPSLDYVNRFRVGGAKLTLDGSPQGKTAWLSTPYFIPPEGKAGDYTGYAAVTNAQAFAEIEKAFANDWQILCHANGDAAIDLFIAAIRDARRKYPDVENRPVLIHGQTLRQDQVGPLQELDIFPSLFPMHTYYWGDWHRESVLGPERAEDISPTGWIRDRGMRFGTHHDAPVALPDSMRVLSATVTRRSRSGDILGPYHRVPVKTALKAMTIWPAWQHFEENTKGTIEVGKLADFVVLSENPMTVSEDQLANIKVLETIKEGVSVYVRPEGVGLRPAPAMFGVTSAGGRPVEQDHRYPVVCGDGCFNPALSLLVHTFNSAD